MSGKGVYQEMQMIMRNSDLTLVPLDDTKNYFYSTDFDEATALSAKDYPVFEIDSTKTRSVFIFEKKNGVEQSSKDYWSGALVVSALKLATARRSLKSRLYRTRAIY